MIKFADDCSGISSPAQALKNIGVNYEYVFASEIDKFARKSLEANYKIGKIYEDINEQRTLPKLDIYCCGFPCQPFSTAGLRNGRDDARGLVFFKCIDVIKETNPSLFVLENVTGIKTIHGGEYFNSIKEELKKLDYHVYYWTLCTKDYGIPQSRKRLFIIGSKKELTKPQKVDCRPIEEYIDYSDTNKHEYCKTFLARKSQFEGSTFCSIGVLRPENNSKNKVCPDYSPTITCSARLWCVKLHRRANIKECLALQGFPEDFKVVVSSHQILKQIGNSISVNVLEAIFREYFK